LAGAATACGGRANLGDGTALSTAGEAVASEGESPSGVSATVGGTGGLEVATAAPGAGNAGAALREVRERTTHAAAAPTASRVHSARATIRHSFLLGAETPDSDGAIEVHTLYEETLRPARA